MPATITTRELFPLTTSVAQMDEEVRLRMKAGAIRSRHEKTSENYVLITEWNVFGENG